MSNKYTLREIPAIHNYELNLLNSKEMPEQLMVMIYADIQSERSRLTKRMKLMSINGIVTDEEREELLLEEKKEFFEFLCNLLKKYQIRESYMTSFINDMLTTFDDLYKNDENIDIDNLELKGSTISHILKYQKLNPEQITKLAREERNTNALITELKNINTKTA